jgi:hypothetical protein
MGGNEKRVCRLSPQGEQIVIVSEQFGQGLLARHAVRLENGHDPIILSQDSHVSEQLFECHLDYCGPRCTPERFDGRRPDNQEPVLVQDACELAKDRIDIKTRQVRL